MNNISAFSLEGDSLNYGSTQSELDRLRSELKEKQKVIQDKDAIISSLRSRVQDFEQEFEQLEISEQLLRQETDQLKKRLEEKTQESEAISHALKEIEKAYEEKNRKLEARKEQIKKIFEELTASKKELEEERQLKNQLQHQNELLTIELDSSKLRKRSSRDQDEEDALAEEVRNLRNQINQLKQKSATLLEESAKQHRISLEQLETAKVSKEVEFLKLQLKELKQHNERLSAELKNSKKNSLTSPSGEQQTDEEMVQELYDLRAQVKSLSHRQSRRSIDEEILKLRQELEITETSWKLEKQHKERYARENFQLDKKVNDLSRQLNGFEQQYAMLQSKCQDLEIQLNELMIPPPPLPPKTFGQLAQQQQAHVQDENKTEVTAAIHFSMADEVGEIMDSGSLRSHMAKEKRSLNESSLWNQHDFCSKRSALNNESIRLRTVQPSVQSYCTNHRIQKSQFFNNDPIAEQKMRLERANELARRNMQTKPLHQTSYPLELDTFDTTNFTETEIKNGNVTRKALADSSNQRKPVKKAEAFII